jgi:hypothetical protein
MGSAKLTSRELFAAKVGSMARTAQRKLTSEQRCQKVFDEWLKQTIWADTSMNWPFGANTEAELVLRNCWQACWKYLESRVTEFIHE